MVSSTLEAQLYESKPRYILPSKKRAAKNRLSACSVVAAVRSLNGKRSLSRGVAKWSLSDDGARNENRGKKGQRSSKQEHVDGIVIAEKSAEWKGGDGCQRK
jgi:hypothetical protein